MAEIHPLRPRHNLHQISLDLLGRVPRRQSQAAGKPLHMRVNHNTRSQPERRSEHNVGRLPADARQRRQRFEITRNHPTVVLGHFPGHRQQVA